MERIVESKESKCEVLAVCLDSRLCQESEAVDILTPLVQSVATMIKNESGCASEKSEMESKIREPDAEGFTPILKRREKRQARRQKTVTFNEEVQVCYIERCNLGRKVGEMASPTRPKRAPRNGRKLYRCETPRGTLFVEMDDVAVAYLSYVQNERSCGRPVIVKDFIKEAKEYAAAQAAQNKDKDEQTNTSDDLSEEDTPDMDLYAVSKQRQRRARRNRQLHVQPHRSLPSSSCNQHIPYKSEEDSDGANSEPDIPSEPKEHAGAASTPRSPRKECRQTQSLQRRWSGTHTEHRGRQGYQQDTFVQKQRQNYLGSTSSPSPAASPRGSALLGSKACTSQHQKQQSFSPQGKKPRPRSTVQFNRRGNEQQTLYTTW